MAKLGRVVNAALPRSCPCLPNLKHWVLLVNRSLQTLANISISFPERAGFYLGLGLDLSTGILKRFCDFLQATSNEIRIDSANKRAERILRN